MSLLSQFAGGGIKSIQRGTMNVISSLTTNATISSVVVGKTELRLLGFSGNASDSVRIALTSATNIQATKDNAGAGATTLSWELTEFY